MEISRDVMLESYWPPVVGEIRDFQQIARGENPEFRLCWDAVNRFIQDVFVNTATEWAIERWERIFNLETYPTDTLDQRRARILMSVTRQLPYTMRALRLMLKSLLGDGNFKATVDPIRSELNVLVNVRAAHQMDDVREILDAVVPANLVIKVAHLYSPHQANRSAG